MVTLIQPDSVMRDQEPDWNRSKVERRERNRSLQVHHEKNNAEKLKKKNLNSNPLRTRMHFKPLLLPWPFISFLQVFR